QLVHRQPLVLGRLRRRRRRAASAPGAAAARPRTRSAHPGDALPGLPGRRQARTPVARPARRPGTGPGGGGGGRPPVVARPPPPLILPGQPRTGAVPGHLCRQRHAAWLVVLWRVHYRGAAGPGRAACLRSRRTLFSRPGNVRVAASGLTASFTGAIMD